MYSLQLDITGLALVCYRFYILPFFSLPYEQFVILKPLNEKVYNPFYIFQEKLNKSPLTIIFYKKIVEQNRTSDMVGWSYIYIFKFRLIQAVIIYGIY